MSVSNHAIGGQETIDSIDTTPIECSLSDLGQVRLEMVSGSSLELLWNILVRAYHYLGHHRMFGRRLKYLAFADSRPVAALGWKTASIRLEARDCFIGWSNEQRKKYLKHVVNNNRFLIPPWIRVPNLASHLLACGIRALARDWHERYGRKPFLLESIVDPVYFRGTSYKAANWIYVGKTKGYSLGSSGYEYHGLLKEVYVYAIMPESLVFSRRFFGSPQISGVNPLKKSALLMNRMDIQMNRPQKRVYTG